MKNILLIIFCALPIFLAAQKAEIIINIDRPIGEIDPKIYGVFMEPIQFSGSRFGLPDSVTLNTLYGTLYDPDSPLADENGFRTDYIEAMRELQVTNMRWPGGNFVASYNWQDGIGPKEERPVRKDLAWGAIENNHVGTDEWIQLNKAMGSENVICVNLGLGTINEARFWVEYCNLKETYYAGLRKKYGHSDPYSVKYWCLGNEVDGSPWITGYKNAEDYCKIALEAGKAMRKTDPSIKLISNGSSYYEPSGNWIDWNWKVITELRDVADYLSIHKYWERAEDYYDYVGQSAFEVEEKITMAQAQIKLAKTKYPDMRPLYLSVDEYAPFGQSMQTTIAVAMYLNSFIRHADIVKMANYTLMTSLLGNDREQGTFKTPLFYTFKMYSNNCRGTSVDTYVQCDTFNTERYSGIPFLDVTTSYSKEEGVAYVNVVNRHRDKSISTAIKLTGGTLAGKSSYVVIRQDDLNAPFEYELEDEYMPEEKEIKAIKGSIEFDFPPHSVTQLRLKIQP